jgi:hypothetical protein
LNAASEFLMKYVRMIYADEPARLSASEHTVVEWVGQTGEPPPSPDQLSVDVLAAGAAAAAVRMRRSGFSVTDGPFVETKA